MTKEKSLKFSEFKKSQNVSQAANIQKRKQELKETYEDLFNKKLINKPNH
jgi:hypothetical protein